MITKTILDTIARTQEGGYTELLRAETPLLFVEFADGEHVWCKTPDGRLLAFDADSVEAFHEPEESLTALAKAASIPYDTLARYARDGRIMARKSGGVWLSTLTAIQFASIKAR